MADGGNRAVLVGAVQLFYVQSISISEGYRIERIAGSRFSQALAPTTKTISIEALLIGADRLRTKKALEVMALTSRMLVAATGPALGVTGIPVVSGLTISLDMQITDLRFSQSTQQRDALSVSMTLQHVPRSSATALIGEIADLALAAGSPIVGAVPLPNPIARLPGPPL